MHRFRQLALHTPYAAAALPLAAMAAAVALWLLLPPEQVMGWLKEGGPVEGPSEILYFVAAAVIGLMPGRPGDARVRLALCVLFAAFGAREMDLHKAFTGTSVLKVSFYVNDAPMHQHVVAALLVSCVALAVGYLCVQLWRPLWRAWRRHETVATTVVCFLVAMLVSKVLDRSINLLAEDYGVYASASVHALVSALEEILELSLPLIALLGALQYGGASGVPARPPQAARRAPE